VGNGLPRLLDKFTASISHADPLMIALEELHIEMMFQFQYPLAERGLVDTQPFRCSGEVQFLRQGDRRL
jgi:hypothetical protein